MQTMCRPLRYEEQQSTLSADMSNLLYYTFPLILHIAQWNAVSLRLTKENKLALKLF